MQLQAENQAYSPAGGSGSIRVSTNRECGWSAQSEVGWLSLSSSASGQGDGSVQFTVAANVDPTSRRGGVAVNDGRVEITQSGRPCEYSLSSIREAVDATGGERSVTIEASSAQCPWTAAAGVPWVTITSNSSGSGSGTVTFRVAATDGASRTGTITVAGQVVTVVQGDGCSYSLDPLDQSVPASGGPGILNVRTGPGCGWSASSSADWLVITSASGLGPGEARFTVAPWNGPGRTAAIQVAGRSATISQGAGCTFSIDPASVTAGPGATSQTVRIDTGQGCPWSASTGAPWITMGDTTSGAGPGQVRVAIASNTGPARSGAVTIAGRTLTVSQASGCTYSIAPSAADVPGTGGSVAISIATGAACPWTASTDAGWINPAGTSGAGPSTLSIAASPNSGEPRTAMLLVAGQPFTLRQGSQCTYTLLPPSHQLDANGGGGNILVIVSGPCTWTATSNAEWIRITSGASGAGNGLVQFTATANAGPARTGTLRIAGQPYTVSQAGR